jgi:cytochrome c-type biogenesis protein CcmH
MIALVAVLGILAAAALLLVLRPLLREVEGLPSRARFDRAVYRDQLQELERDIARGLIGEPEARAARLEIERRLLTTGDATAVPVRTRRSPALAAAVGVLVLGGATGLYLKLGAPGIPDTPYALRVKQPQAEPSQADMARLVATLSERLRADPTNREGWQLLARSQATLGNWAGAADAFRKLIALGGGTADAYAGFGEMQVLAADGVVTPAAREAFAAAVRADPASVVPRFYLALADAQAGRGPAAIDAWMALAGETDDTEIRTEIARRVAETAKSAGIAAPALPPVPTPAAPAASQAPGPGPAQVAAAAGMSEAQRDTMIRGMVAQLAARLEANPNDFDGWMRLGRAYAVLAEPDRAADAFVHAASLRTGDAAPLLQGVKAMTEAQKENAPIPQRAVDLLRRAEAIDPKQPETLWYLGLAEAQAGHRDAARSVWERLLAVLPAGGEERKLVTDAIAALANH